MSPFRSLRNRGLEQLGLMQLVNKSDPAGFPASYGRMWPTNLLLSTVHTSINRGQFVPVWCWHDTTQLGRLLDFLHSYYPNESTVHTPIVNHRRHIMTSWLSVRILTERAKWQHLLMYMHREWVVAGINSTAIQITRMGVLGTIIS